MRPTPLLTTALLALALAGCGSGGKGAAAPTPTSTGPANVAAAASEVSKDWVDFFDGALPAMQRAALLESGLHLTQALALSGKDPNATFTTAKVSSVTFTDPTHASVRYDLFVHGTAVLSNADGKAVLVGGRWMVSRFTFCQLLSLKAGAAVPGC
jgi:hypothetical protein